MAVGYYPGCSLKGTAAEFDMSIREVAGLLGMELKEVEDWNCCGASAAHQTNHKLGLALPARNIALAASQGIQEVLAPCAACSNRLIASQKIWLQDEKVRREVEGIVGLDLPDKEIKILNCIEFLLSQVDRIGSLVIKRQEGKKVACYYGCLLVRPPKLLAFDDPEEPDSMERIVEAVGAEPLDWAFKTECCGAAFAVSQTSAVVRLVEKILRNAHEEGANVVAVACPLCHANLDMRQSKRKLGFRIPVLYISQLVGLALGLSPSALGLNKHITPVVQVL